MELNLTIKDIKQLLGEGESTLDDNVVVKRLSSLTSAQPGDMSVILERGDESVFDAISVDTVGQSHAGIFLAKQPLVPRKHYLIVNDPLVALTKLVAEIRARNNGALGHSAVLSPENGGIGYFIHPSAIIGEGVRIGEGTFIGAYVVIGSQVELGKGVIVHPGVVIFDHCEVGDKSIINAHAVIGADGFGYRVSKQGLDKIPHIGTVRIGNEVEIGAQCTIMRATFDQTIIEDRVKLDCSVHLAHNVKIGYGTAILAHTIIGGSADIGKGCQIGGHVAIKDHVKIGDRVKIVSKCAVSADVADDQVVAGIPAIPFGLWKRLTVLTMKLPELARTIREIKEMASAMDKRKGFFRRFFFRS